MMVDGVVDALKQSAVECVEILLDIARNKKIGLRTRNRDRANFGSQLQEPRVAKSGTAALPARRNGEGEAMKFRDRIRRIEERPFPAIKQDGKKLIPPILEAVYVELVMGPGGRRRPTTREES